MADGGDRSQRGLRRAAEDALAMAFLSPSKEKLARALVLASVLPLAFFSGCIPPSMDLLDLRPLGRSVIRGLVGAPIWLFDRMTDSAFAPRSEAFIVFPSTTQCVFALACDALLFYVLACAWVAWRRRRAASA